MHLSRRIPVKKLILSLVAVFVLGLSTAVSADTITVNAPATDPNGGSGGPNQFDLDHHRAYTWRIGNVVVPQGHVITGARLTFTSIRNWDTNPNRLFVHLLDSAKNSGVNWFTDASGAPVPVAQIQDNFAGSLYNSNPLVNAGTGNTFLFDQSFSTTATNFVYNFNQAQVNALIAYLANDGIFALGLDPDCHFWNNGIKLEIFTQKAAVPEPATLTLLGTGLAGLYYRRRRKQQQQSQLAS